ncbi:hypothetical protein [Cupriavidus sp. AcVe19-6a]|uniref:hypothetical protein n=1 Tax=Cupriavidus sp. AcVe19-6a TaxID=2821358 RepID=UPI001AE7C25F|nr:hypothetical protein [Cupriavidus sp. AcVe19-6a]MBP0639121.1 hypothetical protein [Cupriavidus sp. AcVe19-6a]
MSAGERIIQLADLTLITRSLQSLNRDIEAVSTQVTSVGTELSDTRSELARLEEAFLRFVAADLKAKELSLAETRQVKVRQELETTYGYYAEVRRQATGILQAADVSVVRAETVKSATEGLMLAAPRYWLAPALVALAAWLNNQEDLAKRALAEALKRDDEKTSLFFALVSRRAGRVSACRTWLERYFGMQNPTSLDRQSVVLVDALASGVFGGEIRLQCTRKIEAWIEELSEAAGFVEAQRQQWDDGLRGKLKETEHSDKYGHLSRFSPTWPKLNQSLNEAGLHKDVLEHFRRIFEGPLETARSVEAAVDGLLETLVSRFDDEELPLRREDRLNQLIINHSGDRAAAERKNALETAALEEKVSFTQLLTNAAMNPELSHATRATQRYAIALSRTWVRNAHDDLTASFRNSVPEEVEISIDGWQEKTRIGENEGPLLVSLGKHLDDVRDKTLATLKLGLKHWTALGVGIVALLMAMTSGWFFLLVAVVAIGWFFTSKAEVAKAKAKVIEEAANRKNQCESALKAVLAEVVEWRRDVAAGDAFAIHVGHLLDGISPEQYTLTAHDKARRVMTQAA